MKTKITILILSVIYCGYLLTLWAAEHYKSTTLNPLNSEYYCDKGLLTEAIETEPSNALYHMLYALCVIKQNQSPDDATRKLILIQLKQAVELKPFSKKYKKIYNIYAPFLQ